MSVYIDLLLAVQDSLAQELFDRGRADFPWARRRNDLYQRPATWRHALDCDVQQQRWEDWTAGLEPRDKVFHAIPDGLEPAYCAILDWFRWDYLKNAYGHNFPEPDNMTWRRSAQRRGCRRAERERIVNHAHSIWMCSAMTGQPWHIIAQARQNAFCCHQIDHYRRRAGKPVTYEPTPPKPKPARRKSNRYSYARRRA